MTEVFRTLGNPVDERTGALDLPLPHPLNDQRDDVQRLREALGGIDTAMQLMGLDIESRDDALQQRAELLEWAAARSSQVAYGYDAQGRVETITTTVNGVARVMALTYDGQGRVAQVAYPVAGGATRTDAYQYDAQGRVAQVNSTEQP